MINIERQCVEQALIVKSNAAHRRLADLRKNGRPLENPFSGLSSGVEWEKDLRKRMIQAVSIPLILFVAIFLAALIFPIAYLVNIRTIYKEKRDLERQIKLFDLNLESTNKPNIKTVESLWKLHGLDNSQFTRDECTDLLLKWIKILYGADTAMNINIGQKVAAITAKRIELNRSYYENPSRGPHFHFVPVLSSLLELISNELPAYAPED